MADNNRDVFNPYGAFNFEVSADGFPSGFQEVTGLGIEVTEAEYRNGNERQNHVHKMNGLSKYSDVTCKRGIVGATEFFSWIKQVSDGDPNQRKDVTITLKDETANNTVMIWLLHAAKPKSYKGPSLNAKGGDLAMEELVLSYEWQEVKTQ